MHCEQYKMASLWCEHVGDLLKLHEYKNFSHSMRMDMDGLSPVWMRRCWSKHCKQWYGFSHVQMHRWNWRTRCQISRRGPATISVTLHWNIRKLLSWAIMQDPTVCISLTTYFRNQESTTCSPDLIPIKLARDALGRCLANGPMPPTTLLENGKQQITWLGSLLLPFYGLEPRLYRRGRGLMHSTPPWCNDSGDKMAVLSCTKWGCQYCVSLAETWRETLTLHVINTAGLECSQTYTPCTIIATSECQSCFDVLKLTALRLFAASLKLGGSFTNELYRHDHCITTLIFRYFCILTAVARYADHLPQRDQF